MKTLHQERAKFAWEKVNEIKSQHPGIAKEYKSYVKKAPAMIMTNGIGNTVAFFLSPKKGLAYHRLYAHFEEWFKQCFSMWNKQNLDLINWIVVTDSLKVFKVTQEILALLNWMKRFAEIVLEGDEGGPKNT